jgi:GntR family transcriptional regulator/MocR family aminotransferase
MQAPPGTDTDLAGACTARGVRDRARRPFSPDQADRAHFYRLAYSSIPAEPIAEGIAILAEEMARSGPMRADHLALTGRPA